MIIDVTREFTDEEYENYFDLIKRYDEKQWEIEQDREQWHDSPAFVESGQFYEVPIQIEELTTSDEDDFLEQLYQRVYKCVKHLEKNDWVIFERILDYNIILWLDAQNVSYYVIHDPMEFDYFWLAIKDVHARKMFLAKWNHNIDAEYFKGQGWIKYRERMSEEELEWCKENLENDFIYGFNSFYFTEEAIMMYKLAWS